MSDFLVLAIVMVVMLMKIRYAAVLATFLGNTQAGSSFRGGS